MGKSQSKLSHDQLLELSNNTHFNTEEIKHWFKAFHGDCPSGALTKDEFCKIYEQFFPFGRASAFANHVFSAFDQDKDGVVTFPEFVKALSITARGDVQEKLNWAFDLYDTNGDGIIDATELKQIVDAINSMVGGGSSENAAEIVSKIFIRMGKDSTESMRKDEFRNNMMMEPSVVQAISMYNGLV